MCDYFDYEKVGHEAGLTEDQVKRLLVRWREDYPNDPLLLELRLLRTCMAIKDGHCTFEQAMERESTLAGTVSS